MSVKRWALLTGLVLAAPLTAGARFIAFGGRDAARSSDPNPAYDGRYAFLRLRYRTLFRDNAELCSARFGEADDWGHNHPTGELNLLKILGYISTLDVKRDSTAVLTAADPELLKYPVAYVAEAACWRPTDAEVVALRNYMLKGGFLIVDDLTFSGPHPDAPELYRTADETIALHLRRILPELKQVPLTAADPVFQTFFALDPKSFVPPRPTGVPPMSFSGIYEDNDRTKRLLALVTHNVSIAYDWRFASRGFNVVDVGNQAYKLGVNFVLYGVTH